MASIRRNLPARSARNVAIERLNLRYTTVDDEVDEDDDAIDEDDAVADAPLDIDDSDHEQASTDDEELDVDVLQREESTDDSSVEENDAEEEPGQLLSVSGLIWHEQAPQAVQGRQPVRNVFRGQSGFRPGLHPTSRREAFHILMDGFIMCAVTYTNIAGRRFAQDRGWRRTDPGEMEAFIGLHMLAGVFKAYHRNTRELWSERDGHSLFRATMSFKRFAQLKMAFRFDDSRRRDRDDKLAAVRHIVSSLNLAINANYKPGPFLCVDEMLVEFHGRVSFRQYIPTKPGKFGIKIFWCVDVENTMPLKCIVYIGAGTIADDVRTFTHRLVMELVKDYLDAGRNVTGDNLFTSEPLMTELCAKRTTYLGTCRINKRELPPASKSITNRTRGDTRHYYTNQMTLCSFWDKGRKPVILLSSMHGAQPNTRSIEDGKSDVVLSYNQTKSGVDNLDKLVRGYRCKRKCRRWPYAVAMTLVDVAVVASFKMMVSQSGCVDDHYTFKRELAYELCKPLMERRIQLPRLRTTVKTALRHVGLVVPEPARPAVGAQRADKPGRCDWCPRHLDKKTRVLCVSCAKFTCVDHCMSKCVECTQNN